jgi:transcriptional regulator with XRE-family HTH domain
MGLPSSSAQQALEQLGRRLRELRQHAGFTNRTLARLAGWHESKISKIEYGRQAPSVADIRTTVAHCDGDRELTDELTASLHAVEGMFLEWRRLEGTGLRRPNEAEARIWERTKRFRIYSSTVIPGPVQTGAYIHAVLSSLRQQRGIPGDDLAETVQVRLGKQEIVHRPGCTFSIVIEESVLRSPVGGADTMAAALGHLLGVTTLPSVSIGIIPLDCDRSAIWNAESFWTFDDNRVTVELISGHLTITQPQEIALYELAFHRLSQLAVYGGAARTLIANAIVATSSGSTAGGVS